MMKVKNNNKNKFLSHTQLFFVYHVLLTLLKTKMFPKLDKKNTAMVYTEPYNHKNFKLN